jgi:hypothetical protein
MEIIIKDISIVLPDENNGINRDLIIFDDGEFLQINFIGESDKNRGCITLTKDQMIFLRDNLSSFIKNKLVE